MYTRLQPRSSQNSDMFRAILLLAIASLSAQSAPPRFEDYPVRTIYQGPTHAPNFGDPRRFEGSDIRCFGAEPDLYTGAQVNFAGRFVIRACSCGTGCHYLFMWDAMTGRFYQSLPPFKTINVGLYRSAVNSDFDYEGEKSQPDSALLVIEGCLNETCDCARRYYRWTGKQFKQMATEPVQKPMECRR